MSATDISHARQELIEGWDQSAVEESRIILHAGTDNWPHLTELLALGARAMGFPVNLACAPSRPLLAWGQMLTREVNRKCGAPAIEVFEHGARSTLIMDEAWPTIVLSSAAGARGYAEALNLAMGIDADLVVLFAIRGDGEFRLIAREPWGCLDWIDEALNFRRCALRPLPRPVALIAAGMMLEAAVREVLYTDSDELPFGELQFPLDLSLTGCDNLVPNIPEGILIGAGGIGAPAAYGLSAVQRLHVYDGDEAEPSNRARAIWLEANRNKAEGLACEFGRRVVPHPEFVTEQNARAILQRHPEARFVMLAVDNWDTRALMSEAFVDCRRGGWPGFVVNAGCSITGARAHTIGFQRAACLSCRRPDLAALRQRERQSCSEAPQPSILVTNWIAAGLGGLLVHGVLGTPPLLAPLRMTYDTASLQRLAVDRDLECDCLAQAA